MQKVGFLGPKGTFSHGAMISYMSGRGKFEAQDYNTIEDLLLAAHTDEVTLAVVPMENSLEGAVNATMDMLATDDVHLIIKDEFVIPVQQNLLVKEGTRRSEITCVMSHPQPLGQCRKYLNSNLPGVEIRATYSTAVAAELVAGGEHGWAAVGSEIAAEVYGLQVLESDIQDGDSNFTRFVIMSREENKPSGNDKTSIVFSTEDKPGSLYRILDIFNLWDINMTRIESRPAKRKLGRYIFFVDIKGHHEDEDVKSALTMVQRKTSFYKFLGSYPEYSEQV